MSQYLPSFCGGRYGTVSEPFKERHLNMTDAPGSLEQDGRPPWFVAIERTRSPAWAASSKKNRGAGPKAGTLGCGPTNNRGGRRVIRRARPIPHSAA
jgi:hypothetical protein